MSLDGDKNTGLDATLNKAEAGWQHLFLAAHAKSNEKATKSADTTAQSAAGPNWSQIGQTAQQVLSEINPQGRVTLTQLAGAMQNDNFKGEQAQVLAALYDNFDRIQSLSGGQKFFAARAVTTGDIDALVKVATGAEQEYHQRDNLAYWAVSQGNLKKLFPNGAVTEQSLKDALAKNNLSGADRANLQILQANFAAIASDGKVGSKQLVSYLNNYKTSNANFKLDDSFLQDMEIVNSSEKDNSALKLFANESSPVKSVSLDGLKQGYTGDCAFEAALAGLVATRPQEIPKMIAAANGDFLVAFPGAKGHKLEVKPPTEAERGLFDQANANGDWNNVLKKAYGQLVAQTDSNAGATAKSKTPEEVAGEDGYQDQAIAALTNHKVENQLVSQLSVDQLNKELLQASNDHRIVVLNTAPSSPVSHTQLGFESGHAFTVVKVNSDGSQITSLAVRDPRNQGDNKPDGTMQVSLKDVEANFRTVSIETDKPL